MLDVIKEYIAKEELIVPGDHILVGVSGGPDSVALLTLLQQLSGPLEFDLTACHVDHGLRSEAREEAEFVERYAKSLDVPCVTKHFDAAAYAAKQKRSVEEASRDFRYGFYDETAGVIGANKVALAHHKDDLCETVLFRMSRGTGLAGMEGIPVKRPLGPYGFVDVIRPLLCVTKEEILAYLESAGIAYCIDASNASTIYARNKIRAEVMPALKEVNEKAVDHIAELASTAGEYWRLAERFADELSRDALQEIPKEEGYGVQGICLLLAPMKEADPCVLRHLVYRVLTEVAGCKRDWEDKHVNQVIALTEKETGKRVDLPYQVVALKRRDAIWVMKREQYEAWSCKRQETRVE